MSMSIKKCLARVRKSGGRPTMHKNGSNLILIVFASTADNHFPHLQTRKFRWRDFKGN